MHKLQCSKCNYAFEKKEMPKRCPYCGEEGTLQPYKTAQDWLDEADI